MLGVWSVPFSEDVWISTGPCEIYLLKHRFLLIFGSPQYLDFYLFAYYLFFMYLFMYNWLSTKCTLQGWMRTNQGQPRLRAGDQHPSLGSASQSWKVTDLRTGLYCFPVSFWTSSPRTLMYRNLRFMIPSHHRSGQGPFGAFLLFYSFILWHLCPHPNANSRT